MILNRESKLGPYEILEPLGAGGMGEVYKGRDTRLGRIVAIKLLSPDRIADPIRKQRFFQEARAASALNHPNIITIHDVGVEGQIDYLVMEYVQGNTLEQIIARKGLRVSDVLQYAIQIADALAAGHASGIVHRDIKPSNLMVTEGGRIKVLDFGLAKLVEQTAPGEEDPTRTMCQTREGMVVGSAPYMSPEQAEGKVVDGRTDIFSLGAVLYEMCTGRRAFLGQSTASTLAAVITEDPAPMEQAAPQTCQ
jgi:serine/threonine protein kinase